MLRRVKWMTAKGKEYPPRLNQALFDICRDGSFGERGAQTDDLAFAQRAQNLCAFARTSGARMGPDYAQ